MTPCGRISVIVTSYESPHTLRECLTALVSQAEAVEIVVADCSLKDPAIELRPDFPQVRFLHWDSRQTVPVMRWAALGQTSEAVVAAIEARCVPAPDWCTRLLETHERIPAAPAAGGPVNFAPHRPAWEAALYFAEYGMFTPPINPGPSVELSGANLSYKRRALAECEDLLRGGAWETLLHARWRAANRPLALCGAEITFKNTMGFTGILRQRFHYGRGYAAARTVGGSWVVRLGFTVGAPMLPLLFAWRTARANAGKGRMLEFFRSLPFFLLYQSAWAAGEACGYIFGASAVEEIF